MVDRSDGLSAPLNYTHTGQKARAVKHMTRWVLKGGSRVFNHKNSAHTILSAVGHLATIVDTMDGLALEAGDGNTVRPRLADIILPSIEYRLSEVIAKVRFH